MTPDDTLQHIVDILDNLINVVGYMEESTLNSLTALKREANRQTDERLNKEIAKDWVGMPMSNEDYVKLQGQRCPYCGSFDLHPDVDRWEYTHDSIFIPCKCLACNKEWSDQYKLVGYSPMGGK